MSLYVELQKAKSEEDVKDAYIKAIGLKGYSKNLIDIQTKEVWFEAKDTAKLSTYKMFTQLLHYVQVALNKDEYVPPFLCVIDTQKASIMRSVEVIPFLKKKTIKWGKSASSYTQEALDAVSTYIGTHFVSFRIETHESEFISTIKEAIKTGEIVRTNITPDNLKQVFDKWVAMIGCEINGVDDDEYALLFYADIMHDGTVSTHANLSAQLLHRDGSPVFMLNGKIYELSSREGYRQFWSIYQKPPKEEYRNYLLERRDSLIPCDERKFKGAYYTPLNVVDKAYDLLGNTLGKNWQKEYIVWDMCCGVGNLEIKHSNPRNIFMSTLDNADVDVMKAAKTCVAATRFQYDYLNDDISDDGVIDYALSKKIPKILQNAIASNKKILILINPPYAEAANSQGNKGKTDVASTKFSKFMNEYGFANRELFTQFLVRIQKEIPNATVAVFSKLKYINAPNFEKFRTLWKAEYLDGFIVHSKSFDSLKGDFPIGFLIWKLSASKKINMDTEISTEALDKNCNPIGSKVFYTIPSDKNLNGWLPRLKTDTENIPLTNAVTPQPKHAKVTAWRKDAIGYMLCNSNDIQNAPLTAILSSVYSSGNGFYITAENLWRIAIIFTVRRIVKRTWINDRDQFLIPTLELDEEFKTDCLIWMLFNGSNLTAGADKLEWDNSLWSIINHFIPFSEAEVNAPERFESDFMYQYLSDKKISKQAKLVLGEGKLIWCEFFSKVDARGIREKYKLNRSDAGWYQIRKAIEERNADSDLPTSFRTFETAYSKLEEKILPQVYSYGFLK